MRLLLLFCLLSCSIYSSAQNSSVDVDSLLYSDALRFFYENKSDSAIILLKRLETRLSNKQEFNEEDYVKVIYSLVSLYTQKNLVKEGEDAIYHAEEILRLKGCQDTPLKRHILYLKGSLRLMIDDIEDAKDYFSQAKSIYDRERDNNSLEYVRCLANLATAYFKSSDYIFSINMLNKALKISDRILSEHEDSVQYYILDNLPIRNTIAVAYEFMGDSETASKLRRDALDIAEKYNAVDAIAGSILNESYAQIIKGNYSKAIQILKSIERYNLSYTYKDYYFQNLFASYYFLNDKSVIGLLKQYDDYLKRNIEDIFSTYSESEREIFWNQRASLIETVTNSVCLKYKTPDLIRMAYNNALFTKSFMFRFSNYISKYASQNTSPIIREKYEEMLRIKKAITDKSIPNENLKNEIDKIKTLERDIIKEISYYDEIFDKSRITCQNIRNSLKSNEVAIEFILAPDLLSSNNFEYYYAALLIRRDLVDPVYIKLCKSENLDDILRKRKDDNSQFLNNLYDLNNDQLYLLLFEPLESYLKKGETLYYSPTGSIHEINVHAISNKKNRMMDNYNIVELSSTSLLIDKPNKQIFENAFVIGGADYNENVDDMILEAQKFTNNTNEHFMAMRSVSRGSWEPLPGSTEEAEKIDSILSGNKLKTIFLTGKGANEESFKNLDGQSTDLIHIATHGFFCDNIDTKSTEFFSGINTYTIKRMPMQYSGLILAGGNNAWIGKKLPSDIEDGILTAEEISHMDLSETKIVVLSACDTGLGEVDNIDGVYGLQRGFKMAGVETIVMSLWKVPDEATKMLMIEFYKNLMKGKSKNKSLTDAQKYLQKVENGKYKKPEYWASFIMLDGIN